MTDPQEHTPEPPDDYEILAASPFNTLTGPFYGRQADDGRHSFLVYLQKRHLNRGRSAHGGMLLNLCDISLGRAARWAVGGDALSTTSLQCDFVSMAPGNAWLEGTAWVTRKTRALIFVSGELHSKGKLVMTASGVWKVLGAR